MSKSFEEMNLSEFVEYFEHICTSIGLDLEDGNNFAVKALHYLKEYEGTAAVKTYTQEELNETITKALNDMTEVLERKDEDLEVLRKKLRRYSVCTIGCPYLKTSVILDSLYITRCIGQKGCPRVTIGVTQCPYITESEDQSNESL